MTSKSQALDGYYVKPGYFDARSGMASLTHLMGHHLLPAMQQPQVQKHGCPTLQYDVDNCNLLRQQLSPKLCTAILYDAVFLQFIVVKFVDPREDGVDHLGIVGIKFYGLPITTGFGLLVRWSAFDQYYWIIEMCAYIYIWTLTAMSLKYPSKYNMLLLVVWQSCWPKPNSFRIRKHEHKLPICCWCSSPDRLPLFGTPGSVYLTIS